MTSSLAVLESEDGFTLIELLVSMLVGILVTFAALSLVDVSTTASKGVVDRVDATQRGRSGMEQIVQQLRGIACPPVAGGQSIVAAGPSAITFSADVDNDEDFDPVERRLRAVPQGSYLDVIGDINGANPRTIIDEVESVKPVRPVFVYSVPSPDGKSLDPLPANATVATADLPRIARIEVAFATRPTALTGNEYTTVPILSSVYPRQGLNGQTQTVPTFGC